jgi:hypothetical protein
MKALMIISIGYMDPTFHFLWFGTHEACVLAQPTIRLSMEKKTSYTISFQCVEATQ